MPELCGVSSGTLLLQLYRIRFRKVSGSDLWCLESFMEEEFDVDGSK
jgi:hypothetical protein